jgi:hypothetical protein
MSSVGVTESHWNYDNAPANVVNDELLRRLSEAIRENELLAVQSEEWRLKCEDARVRDQEALKRASSHSFVDSLLAKVKSEPRPKDALISLYGVGKRGDVEIAVEGRELTLLVRGKSFRQWLCCANEEEGTRYLYVFTDDMKWRLQIPLMAMPFESEKRPGLTHIFLEQRPSDFTLTSRQQAYEFYTADDWTVVKTIRLTQISTAAVATKSED